VRECGSIWVSTVLTVGGDWGETGPSELSAEGSHRNTNVNLDAIKVTLCGDVTAAVVKLMSYGCGDVLISHIEVCFSEPEW